MADDREREELYTEFMKERDRKEREEKKKERRRRMTAFKELLEQTSGIKVKSTCSCASYEGLLSQHMRCIFCSQHDRLTRRAQVPGTYNEMG